MKRRLLIVGLLLLMWAGTGCVIIDVEKVHSCKPAPAEPVEATIQEIDAVGKLDFDHDRQSGYKRIAQREDLSDAVQIHLIEAVFEQLQFEQAKVDVLLTLVENPSFNSSGRTALLERVDCLAFDHNKKRILDAVNDRNA